VKILVTGGAGFVGSNFIRQLLASRSDVAVVNFDKLTYAGNPKNLEEAANDSRYQLVVGDIADAQALARVARQGFDAAINLAAETHVDRGIQDATPFLRTNVLGTYCFLEVTREFQIPKIIHVSTDEVYGSAPAGSSCTESSPLQPANAYAVSKAAADHLVTACSRTGGVHPIVLRSTNIFGPYQFPEKLIPLSIANALEEKSLPLYGDGLHERDWLYIDDFCRALLLALNRAAPGSVYNLSTGNPMPNLEVLRSILRSLAKPESLISHVQDRPGHDRRYSLDSSKIRRELGWQPNVSFTDGLQRTTSWYISHSAWLASARFGAYLNYYQRQYSSRSEALRN